MEATVDFSKGGDITQKVYINNGNQEGFKKYGPQEFIDFEYFNPKCKYGDKYDVEFPQVINWIDGKPPPPPPVGERPPTPEKK